MCIANEVCPICGKKGKQAKPKWYDWSLKYFSILHQCGNPDCKNFGETYIHEKSNFGFSDHHRTLHCQEHDKVAEIIEIHRRGLTVEGKAQCPIDGKTWSFEIRLHRGC